MRPICLLFVLLLVPPVVPWAQAQADDPIARSRALYRDAATAYEAKDYTAFLAHIQEADRLRPNHPTFVYTLAAAYTLAGDEAAGLATLDRLAALGVAVDVAADDDFASLRGGPVFKRILDRFAANAAPIGRSEVAFTFGPPDFIPEGVAYDPATGAFFVGSIHQGRVVRYLEGDATDFADVRAEGLGSVFGLAVDPGRRWLWVCSTVIPQTRGAGEEEQGRAGVLAYDLATGALQRAYRLPQDGGHWLGDLTVGPAGDVYVTDSRVNAVYTVPAGADTLRVLVPPGPFSSLQGVAHPGQGHHLFVADYAKGIFRIDLTTGAAEPLPAPVDATLLGIDGLAYHDGALVAIQNGIRPQRVVRLSLDADERRITALEVLEANHPRFDEPTLGVVAGDYFYYVANSQWPGFDEAGGLRPDYDRAPPVILMIRL